MLFYLKKKTLNINMFLTYKNIYLSFDFTKGRRKLLKNQRRFFCVVHSGKLSVADTLHEIELWLLNVNEDALLEQLEDSPKKFRPVINISSFVYLNFNIEEEEVLGKLFTSQASS